MVVKTHWQGHVFDTTIYVEQVEPGVDTFATRDMAINDLKRRITDLYQEMLNNCEQLRKNLDLNVI